LGEWALDAVVKAVSKELLCARWWLCVGAEIVKACVGEGLEVSGEWNVQ